ncbi:hypothetical protein [Lysinibacillus sp. NPDC056232]|uniref:hypothetical protein n=1 Tax=Lysinibacillus sp. NPDC056232 TaxID=3345756 RepID=UPI0035D76A95
MSQDGLHPAWAFSFRKSVSGLTIKDANIIPQQELLDCLNAIPKDKEIIVYCWDVWSNKAPK